MENTELKNDSGTEVKVEAAVAPKAKASKSETITITKDQLQAFVREELAKAMGSKVEKPKRVTEHTATVRYHLGQPVTGLKDVVEKVIDGKKVGFVKVSLLDGSIHEVEYLPFLNNSEREVVKIIKQDATLHEINHGTTKALNPDPYNNKTWNGGDIDLIVTSYTYLAEVEVRDGERAGQKFSIPTVGLNI